MEWKKRLACFNFKSETDVLAMFLGKRSPASSFTLSFQGERSPMLFAAWGRKVFRLFTLDRLRCNIYIFIIQALFTCFYLYHTDGRYIKDGMFYNRLRCCVFVIALFLTKKKEC